MLRPWDWVVESLVGNWVPRTSPRPRSLLRDPQQQDFSLALIPNRGVPLACRIYELLFGDRYI